METWINIKTNLCQCHTFLEGPGYHRLQDIYLPCDDLKSTYLEKEMDQIDKEIERLRLEKEKAEKDLKASIFMSKVSSAPPSPENTTGPILDGIKNDEAIFIVNRSRKRVKDMSDDELWMQRKMMHLAQVRLRCHMHGIAQEIIEREEKADTERKKAQKDLDKKYTVKREEKKESPSSGKNLFENLVKSLMAMGFSEEKARDEAVRTIVAQNMKAR